MKWSDLLTRKDIENLLKLAYYRTFKGEKK
jgi:hypothetical protein